MWFRHFFRTHCEYIVGKYTKSPNKSAASIKNAISSPIATFKQREVAPRQEREIRPTTETGYSDPQVRFVGPTPAVTLTTIPTHHLANPSGETHIISDNQVFSSSPKSAEIPLTAMSEPVPVRSPPAAPFAISTTISPRIAHYHPMMTMRSTFFMINYSQNQINPCSHRWESRSKARSNDALKRPGPRCARFPRYERR